MDKNTKNILLLGAGFIAAKKLGFLKAIGISGYNGKYEKNLRVDGNKIYSYNTYVADINHSKKQVKKKGWWSTTTSKHINYVARELGYKVV